MSSFFGMAQSVDGVCHKSGSGICCDTIFGPNCGAEKKGSLTYTQVCKTKRDLAVVCTTVAGFKKNFNDAATFGVKAPPSEMEEYTFK